MTELSLIEFLELYKSLGIICIPTEYKGKKPEVEWGDYRTKKPTEDEYNQWFNNGTQHNIAAICGAPSNNLVILDFDKPGVVEEFFSKKDIHEQTMCVKTNRGEHIYLRTPTPIKTRQIPGILDVLGENHLVTLPPSIHPKGTTYTHIGKDTILEVKDLDTILWKKAEELGYYKKSGVTTHYGNVKKLSEETPPCINDLFKGIGEGSRNNIGFILGVFLKNQGKDEKEITMQLADWNRRNTPPLDHNELLMIVKSVAQNEYGIGCNNPYMQAHCSRKPGECIYQNLAFLIGEMTQQVSKTMPKVQGDPMEYEIKINDKSFKLTTDKMLNPRFFMQRWLEEMDALIQVSPYQWRQIVTNWSKIAEYKQDTGIDTDQVVADKILETLSQCDVTFDKNLALIQKKYFFVEVDPRNLSESEVFTMYYPSSGIKDIIDSTKARVDIRRINNLLRNKLSGETRIMRVNTKTARFWGFRSDFDQIDWKSRVVEKDE